MFIDGLPVRGAVGARGVDEHTGREAYYLDTYIRFGFQVNGPHIISANITSLVSQRVQLIPGATQDVEFSYSVRWEDVSVPYSSRAEYHSLVCLFTRHVHYTTLQKR